LIRVLASIRKGDFRLPRVVLREASFTEPLPAPCGPSTALRRCGRSDRRVGGGGMGILIAQALLARGAEPIVVDIAHARLSLATTLGVRRSSTRPETTWEDAGRPDGRRGSRRSHSHRRQRTDPERHPGVGPIWRPDQHLRGCRRCPDLALDFLDLYHRELASFLPIPRARRPGGRLRVFGKRPGPGRAADQPSVPLTRLTRACDSSGRPATKVVSIHDTNSRTSCPDAPPRPPHASRRALRPEDIRMEEVPISVPDRVSLVRLDVPRWTSRIGRCSSAVPTP